MWPPPHCEISRVVKRARCREGRRARGEGGNNIERMGLHLLLVVLLSSWSGLGPASDTSCVSVARAVPKFCFRRGRRTMKRKPSSKPNQPNRRQCRC